MVRSQLLVELLGCTVINTPDVSKRQNRACILAFVLRALQCNLHFFIIFFHCADRLSSVLLLLSCDAH
jgi:hypothetical protein